MNTGDVLAVAREWLDDAVAPYLWSDETLLRYINEAQDEAATRTRRIVDSTASAVCSIALVAGQRSYTLHEAVIVARRIEFRPTDTTLRWEVLDRTTTDWLDTYDRHWQQLTGRPNRVVQDLAQRTLTLDREPTASTLGALALTVWRRSLSDERLIDGDDTPLAPLEDRIHLAHWPCFRAFSHKDSEQNDPQRAAEHKALFDQHFGQRPTTGQLRALATDDAGEVAAYHY